MASSNRHWPSMFKSKPSNPNHQFQHDINPSLISTGCHRSPYISGCDEKSPEPKPRWNPKPEQIRILEAIFNSGMVNPPREDIRKIRIQLQEYGQVGDANVFYWFQNRKSRSKHKLRHLNNTKNQNSSSSSSSSQSLQNPANSLPQFTATNNNSSSSSSSEKSSPKEMIPPNNKGFSIGLSNVTEVVPNSPTASVNQTYFQAHNQINLLPPPPEPFFPSYHNGQGVVVVGTNNGITTQGYGFSELSNVIHQGRQPHTHGPSTNLLLSEIMSHGASSKRYQDHQDKDMKIMNQQHSQFISFCQASTPTPNVVVPSITNTTVTVPSPITQLQGVGGGAGTAKSTVFINDVAFEVAVGPFNVREAFGDEAVLVQPSGHPILTDDWGVTLQPLQHGASYYLI